MPTSTLNPEKLRWDNDLQRFLYSNGKVVKPADIRKFIDKLIDISGGRLYSLGEALRAGELRVTRWQTLAAKEIKNVHTAAYVIARGGYSQVNETNLRDLEKILKFQLRHLRDFATSMPAKRERDGRIAPRLQSYARAAIGTYENTTLDRNVEFGLSIARRVTAYRSDSCDDCIDEEDIGWQDINEIRRIGDTPCGPRCNCMIEYEDVSRETGRRYSAERVGKPITERFGLWLHLSKPQYTRFLDQ